MSDTILLTAEPRSDSGKGASRRLRHQGLVPAIVYGGKNDPVRISIPHNKILHDLATVTRMPDTNPNAKKLATAEMVDDIAQTIVPTMTPGLLDAVSARG